MRTIMRTAAGMALVGLLSLGAACALEATDPDTEIVVVEEPGEPRVPVDERVSGDTYDLLDWPPAPTEVDDPCDCESQSCLDYWVSKNLGCDVCIVLTCGDQSQHVCSHCDPAQGPDQPQ